MKALLEVNAITEITGRGVVVYGYAGPGLVGMMNADVMDLLPNVVGVERTQPYPIKLGDGIGLMLKPKEGA